MSIYDDINIIKREGLDNIEYDSQGNVVSNKGTIEDAIAGGLIKDSSSDAFFGEPVNVGNLYPEGYGDSRYDYSTNWRAFEQGGL